MTSRAVVICDSISWCGGVRLTTIDWFGQRLVTATEKWWRRAPMQGVGDILDTSAPRLRKSGEWHLPYISAEAVEDAVIYLLEKGPAAGVTLEELDRTVQEVVRKMSVARCSRMSWASPSVGHDLALYDHIIKQREFMYMEHQALPDWHLKGVWAHPHYHGTLEGWQQYRKMFVGESQLIPAA